MNQAEYDLVTEGFLAEAKGVEDSKRPGYTTGTQDVLSNFKRIAEQTGTIPEKIAMIYMLKHLDSIRTVLNRLESRVGGDIEDPEPWNGRLQDILNYVKLLHALLWEREAKPVPGPRPTNGGSET